MNKEDGQLSSIWSHLMSLLNSTMVCVHCLPRMSFHGCYTRQVSGTSRMDET